MVLETSIEKLMELPGAAFFEVPSSVTPQLEMSLARPDSLNVQDSVVPGTPSECTTGAALKCGCQVARATTAPPITDEKSKVATRKYANFLPVGLVGDFTGPPQS